MRMLMYASESSKKNNKIMHIYTCVCELANRKEEKKKDYQRTRTQKQMHIGIDDCMRENRRQVFC